MSAAICGVQTQPRISLRSCRLRLLRLPGLSLPPRSTHSGSNCIISTAHRSNVTDLPHCRRIRAFMLTAWLRGARLAALLSLTNRNKYRDEDRDCSGCDACPGDCGWRCRYPAPTARLSDGPVRQDADWQDPHREDPDRQDARRGAALCAVLTGILVDPELYHRQLKGEPWQTG